VTPPEVTFMDEKALPQAAPKTSAEYEAAIDQCLKEMERLQQQIKSDEAEIHRLKLETRAVLAKIRAA
jgi:ABC-type Zn uptake system ZnuABC Zn-binding protein ZnuA